jgi:hypothetical protein
MNMPGFNAETSLYGPGISYQMGANSPDSRLQVTPALGVETGPGFCARKANECTDACRPEDSACRDDCDTLFWCCLTGCNVEVGLGGFRQAGFRMRYLGGR